MYRYRFEVVCIEEDYFTPVELGKIYTVTDIIEAGSTEETYILEGFHPDGTSIFKLRWEREDTLESIIGL